MHIAVLNGPNLNRLGKRPVQQYGNETLAQLEARIGAHASHIGVGVTFFQSNHEGELIDRVYDDIDDVDGFIVNPAGLTTYGRSLADALAECGVPYAVVHLSQPYRHRGSDMLDVFRDRAAAYICGLGWRGYAAALDAFADTARSESD
ncbi:hypothetical protein ASF88_16785 [Leifsonia sp. Leaf336]|uniref:type II 3-dehydroquinate dehydratase n=1 Tax=Leifsonia sp. Leaf336 TaxID=1736341 RepID=UPI0007022691|nr:type II 3-dehydroquinate dehydratase [Leifsonia sp. Leaf336]KQR50881.1 hypothetical protein ASF88_16785 [Leifsonia sp. Leaf336]